MRTPVHARFVNHDYARFQEFYRANSNKFQRKKLIKEIPSSSGTEKVVYEYLETSDGYLVYRDGVTMRVASPAEVHANTALLESSMSLYQELHGATEAGSLPKARKVTHFQPDRSALVQSPSMQPPSIMQPLARPPVQPPISSTPPIHDNGSPLPPGPQTVEDAVVQGTLEIIPGDDHTSDDEQLFYQECCQFIHDFGGGTEEGAQRIKPLVYGALVASGKGINWPPPENLEESDEYDDTRFGRLQINFSELTPSGTEKGTATDNKQIIKSRFAAARHELKKHELFLRTPAISSEQLQKNMIRKEMHAINQYIREHYPDEAADIPNFLWDNFHLPDTLAYQAITYLLSEEYGDRHVMPAKTVQAACDLSKAVKKKAQRDKLQPPYRPRYTAQQMKNPGLSERRGISLFEQLKERAGPGGIWDSPYTHEDVEDFRRYYYSRLPSVKEKSDVGNQAFVHFHKTLRDPDG